MRKIRIGFSRSTKKLPIAGWAIQMWQGFTPYSHVYVKLMVKPVFPSNKILHAAEGQVSHYSETSFLKRNKIVEEFEIEIPDQMYKILKRDIFHEKAGEPYSILQNLGIVYVCMMRKLFGIKVKNPWTEGWNCSEYASHVLKQTHPELMKDIDPNLVTPKDLHKLLKSLE